jgi:predicted transcriptional regulator
LIGFLEQVVEYALNKTPQLSQDEVQVLLRQILKLELIKLNKARPITRFANETLKTILKSYSKVIKDAISDEFKDLAKLVSKTQLEKGCALSILKDFHWSSDPGIVVAGFGKEQFFPSLRCYKLNGFVNGRLRVVLNEDRTTDIDLETTGVVLAFAQSDMVQLFMNGVDSGYMQFFAGLVDRIFVDGFPSTIADSLKGRLTPSQINKLKKELNSAAATGFQSIVENITQYSKEMHWSPIVQIVAHLPKNELASMAEALVNLTSLKRHITSEAETVGGPIDVAVISKGDGLIWIKRKHYFEPNMNPNFFANYLYGTKPFGGNK